MTATDISIVLDVTTQFNASGQLGDKPFDLLLECDW
jgi:hypothetical protein